MRVELKQFLKNKYQVKLNANLTLLLGSQEGLALLLKVFKPDTGHVHCLLDISECPHVRIGAYRKAVSAEFE